MAFLYVFSLLLEVSNHLLLLGELILHKLPEGLSLSLESPLELAEALLVLYIEGFPEKVCHQGIHEAGLIL